MSRRGRVVALLTLSSFVLLATGCGGQGGPWPARSHDSALEASRTSTAHGSWPFAPTSIRVHPLTRRIMAGADGAMPSASATADARTQLEVRIECRDLNMLETRAVGSLWLELGKDDARLTVGPIDLGDIGTNREMFEAVTRTYRVSVSIPDESRPAPGSSLIIRAFLRLPDGSVLRDDFELPWRE